MRPHSRQHVSGPSPRPGPRRPALLSYPPDLPPSHSGNRLVLYCAVLYCPNLRISVPCQAKEHELRIRRPAFLLCTQVQSLTIVLDHRGAVIHPPPSPRQPYLASLTGRRSSQQPAPCSTSSYVARCSSVSRRAARLLLVTRIPGRVDMAVTVSPHLYKPLVSQPALTIIQ